MANTLRVLIADDHDIVRQGVRALLEAQKNWTVCAEAATGREAVAMALQQRPDIVVMDFSMPDLNGIEAITQIRASLPDLPILLLTMHESQSLAREALTAGARGIVLKNETRQDLVPAVQALSEGKVFFSNSVSTMLVDIFVRAQTRAPVSTAGEGTLSVRERQVLQLVANGKRSREIADCLGISKATVDKHRANIMKTLNLRSVTALVHYAILHKIV
jgi:DNA-binding NarL/FixJ family response regulator